MNLKDNLKNILPKRAVVLLRRYTLIYKMLKNLSGKYERCCPVCGYEGLFEPYGVPPRLDAKCPSCESLERHRLLLLACREHDILAGIYSLLHIAPEACLSGILRTLVPNYVTADLHDPKAELRIDIEETGLPNESFDGILCSHVLEHVDDAKALREIHRTLKPNGKLIAMVPLVEGCAETYEDASIRDPGLRQLHFGQEDHVRVYGADFRERVARAGFHIDEHAACGAEVVKYRLTTGEKVFVCHKV